MSKVAKWQSHDLSRISAATKVVAVIGHPVSHSLSPLLHNAAFAAMDLDWVSVGFDVEAGTAEAALDAAESFGLVGLSVTMPHKSKVASLLERLSDQAAKLNAVNCVAWRNGEAVGVNTDGEGFVRSILRGGSFDPTGKRCMVLGSGGAARAIALALADASVSEVVIVARSHSSAERCALIAGSVGKVGTSTDAADMDLIVNATPVGMIGAPGELATPLVAPDLLHRGQLVVDVVYQPRVTPWLDAAARQGATTLGGLGMLVHQAELAILEWSGVQPPVETMWDAVSHS